MVCSAAESTLDCGALTTITPRRVAAATSTLSSPMPARPTTTRSVPASSTAAVTWVAERMIRAAQRTYRVQQLLRRQPDRHVDLVAGGAQQGQARFGDLLGDQHPCHGRSAGDELGQPGDALHQRLVAEGIGKSPVPRGTERLARHERHPGLVQDERGQVQRRRRRPGRRAAAPAGLPRSGRRRTRPPARGNARRGCR